MVWALKDAPKVPKPRIAKPKKRKGGKHSKPEYPKPAGQSMDMAKMRKHRKTGPLGSAG